MGARAALEQAGVADQVVIVGFDGQPDGKQAIKDGKIYADPIQFPDKMGIQVVDAIVKLSNGVILKGFQGKSDDKLAARIKRISAKLPEGITASAPTLRKTVPADALNVLGLTATQVAERL